MEKALLILGVMLGVSGLQAQNPDPVITDSSQMAKIVFGKAVYDCGGIEYRSEGVYSLRFENKGQAQLVLTDVSSSCQCTVPSWPKEPIDPGKSGEISVRVNTNVPGPFSASITVSSNASDPKVVLSIMGEVKPQDPDRVQNDSNRVAKIVFLKLFNDFGIITNHSDVSCAFGFVNKGNIPLVISEVKGPGDFITAFWPKEEIKPGDSGTISITCKTTGLMDFDAYVEVISNSFDYPSYLRVIGKVEQK